MESIGCIKQAQEKVITDIQSCLSRIQTTISTSHFLSQPHTSTLNEGAEASEPSSHPFNQGEHLKQGILTLQKVRSESYEDVNQIQHEYLILRAMKWLIENGICNAQTQWYWNPRQTGGCSEPDLRGCLEGRVISSSEVTTSLNPVGTIDTRMQRTLSKLSLQPGRLHYFVQTEAMAKRARIKIRKSNLNIEVVQLGV